MPKFHVEWQEWTLHSAIVEAENAEDAAHKAVALDDAAVEIEQGGIVEDSVIVTREVEA